MGQPERRSVPSGAPPGPVVPRPLCTLPPRADIQEGGPGACSRRWQHLCLLVLPPVSQCLLLLLLLLRVAPTTTFAPTERGSGGLPSSWGRGGHCLGSNLRLVSGDQRRGPRCGAVSPPPGPLTSPLVALTPPGHSGSKAHTARPTARHVCHMCAQLPAPRRTQLLTPPSTFLEGSEQVQVRSLDPN